MLASFGHVRDLPAKDGSVDPDARFPDDLGDRRQGARSGSTTSPRRVKGADKLILATDPDREGEAISWHVLEVLQARSTRSRTQKIERVVFNAITKQAVPDAMKHPRQIDGALVDAYLARRALDYLVGFTLSPVLWRKLPGARSAGRVQSVALRLVCDRELEIEKFVAARILVAGRDPGDAARRHASRRGWSAPTARRSSGSTSAPAPKPKRSSRRSKPATFSVAAVEAKPARRNPHAALHHLDPAAGSQPQARLRARAHHADRAAAL